MKRLYGAIKKYLFKDTAYFFLYTYRYFQDNYKNNCRFYTDSEFVEQIKRGRSIIRIGDGEIDLIHFLKIHYQKYSNSIRSDLLHIVKEYDDSSGYMLLIPTFVNQTNTELKESDHPNTFSCWMPLKITYEMIFNKKATYYDAHAFYRDKKFKKLILPYIINKKIIVVTNEDNKKIIRNSDFSKYVFAYVPCPAENAYEYRNTIEQEITRIVDETRLTKNNFVILMSAGLSKTLIYNMSIAGYQILDIGKGIEGYSKNISLEHLI